MTKFKLRKIGVLLSSMLVAAPAFSADKTVNWWYESANPQQQEILSKNMIDKFNVSGNGHNVVIDYRGDALTQQLRVALLSGTGPDVVQTPGPAFVASMARAGQLMSLDDIAANKGWEDRILPFFMDLGRFDGKLYALPKTYETLGLFYNKKVMADNGWSVPTTITEFEKMADEMVSKGIVPIGAGNSNWRPANEWHVTLALNSIAGPDNLQKALTGEMSWTEKPFLDSVNALKRWWDKGYFGDDYFSISTEQMISNLAEGMSAMAPTGSWSFGDVPTYFADQLDNVGFAGFPSGEGVAYPIYALGIGTTFSIASKAENPEGAAEVIDFMFDDEFYTAMNNEWQGEWNLPLRDLSRIKLSEDVLPEYTESMAALASAIDKNQYGYTSWTFMPPNTNSYVVSGIEEVWLDSISPEQFLAELDEIFQRELAEGKAFEIPAR